MISPNVLLIKALCNRNNYTKHREDIPPQEDIILDTIYKTLDDLMTRVEGDISLEDLILFYGVRNENEETGLGILSDLRETEIGEDVIHSCLRVIQERATASKLAVDCLRVVEGTRGFDSLVTCFKSHIDDYERSREEEGSSKSPFVSSDLEELYQEIVKTPGLRWRLKVLNQSLGSLRKGDFGFIFARPEVGKTTFLASEGSNFAEQLPDEHPLLWFNNEQEGRVVMIRIIQSTLNKTTSELWCDIERNRSEFYERTGNRINVFDSASITKHTVERLCEEYSPGLVIFDQIDKLKGFSEDREDLRLGAIYIWARELAKTYCPVIGVCQASASGEGKKWLTMEDTANSKTSKPAEADWVLGIGKQNDIKYASVRYLSIPKNKLLGDEDSIPELRHIAGEVLIDEQRGRYLDPPGV